VRCERLDVEAGSGSMSNGAAAGARQACTAHASLESLAGASLARRGDLADGDDIKHDTPFAHPSQHCTAP